MHIRITNEINFAFNAEISNQDDLDNALVDAKIEYAELYMPDAAKFKSKLDAYQNEIDTGTVRNLHVIKPFMSKYKFYLDQPNHLHLHVFSGTGWDYVKNHTYIECHTEHKKGIFFDEKIRGLCNFVTDNRGKDETIRN